MAEETQRRRLPDPEYLKAIVWLAIVELRANPKNARTHNRRQIRALRASLRRFGFTNPILIDDQNSIIAGHGRYEAAKQEGFDKVPVIRLGHLSPAELRAYALADNRLAELAGWDRELLALELGDLVDLLPAQGLDVSLTGFEVGEVDLLLADMAASRPAEEDTLPKPLQNPVTRRGDLWLLKNHRLLCGDAREGDDFARTIGDRMAAAVFTDPPYNRAVAEIGGRGKFQHSEFAFASGEMSSDVYRQFLAVTLANGIRASQPGAIHYVCCDWRHIDDLLAIARKLYADILNVAIWEKPNPGMGTFYRSAHEMIGVFGVAGGSYRNNIELGRFGRNRGNVWHYHGATSVGRERNEMLALHPTVKPVQLVADALLDCTARGDIVLDQFAGSGTVILAAEKVGRIACAIEYEPRYVDVAIRRWQKATKIDAVLASDGRCFDEIRAERESASQLVGQEGEGP